jgi:hypothetical protein
MNVRWIAAVLLLGAIVVSSACQSGSLSRACLQEDGCEHHPINR